ncbi:MAG: FMN-binding negative transcriptional regulator [Pseudomonadota bacterium]
MHPNRTFRKATAARNIAFAREQGFGLLCVNAEDGPLISHVPFLLSEDGKQLDFHLVKSNPITRRLSAPLRARLAVQGTHSYISPDWYGIVDQIDGTWKLNQNKPDDVRMRAADAVEVVGLGRDVDMVAALMRDPEE